MTETCTCGHGQALHHHEASIARGYRYVCRHVGCYCPYSTPAAGLAAQPPVAARIGAAGVTNEGNDDE